MKTQFCLFFITTVLLASQARGDGLATNQWGAVTNGVQMSISREGGNREVKRNGEVNLLVWMDNMGTTNAWTYFIREANSDPGDGLHCLIFSPSGKDISPKVEIDGGSGVFINLLPGKIEKYTFHLSSICKFDEVGTYKITAEKIFSRRDGTNSVNYWTVVSNPLQVKVVR